MTWNRVTLLISSLQVGGAERVLSTMANYWVQHGRRPSVVTLAAEDEAPFYRLLPGVEYVGLGLLGRSASRSQALFSNLHRIMAVRRSIKRTNPDLVICFMTECNVLGLLATRGLGVPVIVTEHTDPHKCPVSRYWAICRRLTYKWASQVVVLNEHARRFFGGRANVVVIPNPVPRCEGAGDGADRDDRRNVIVALGRLGLEKGYDVLLRAFASLGPEADDWRLEILGEGPQRAALEELARELEIEHRVAMPGVVADPGPYFRSAGIFVLSSRFEGFPMGLCEAMACGAPVISTEYSPGVYELVQPGENGLVVPAEDPAALAGAVRRLVNDAALRRTLGARAMEIAQRYCVDRVMDLWEEAITRAA